VILLIGYIPLSLK